MSWRHCCCLLVSKHHPTIYVLAPLLLTREEGWALPGAPFLRCNSYSFLLIWSDVLKMTIWPEESLKKERSRPWSAWRDVLKMTILPEECQQFWPGAMFFFVSFLTYFQSLAIVVETGAMFSATSFLTHFQSLAIVVDSHL